MAQAQLISDYVMCLWSVGELAEYWLVQWPYSHVWQLAGYQLGQRRDVTQQVSLDLFT